MSLSVRDVGFSYGRNTALDGVSFEVGEGAFCALLGPNGAGKSTLFALLTRLFTTREGTITVAGHDLRAAPLLALRAMGVVFQDPTLDLDLSVRRNLRYFAALQGLSGADARTRTDEVMGRLDIADRAKDTVRALSGGLRRRVEIARALLHRPRVLLLDEATVGLDAASRSLLVGYVHALAADGLTVLWATHLTDEVWPTDRLVILHRGKVLVDAMAEEVASGAGLTDVFLAMTGGRTAA